MSDSKKDAQRFWAKTHYGRNCWEWKGTRNKRLGYGVFWLNGKQMGAHRAAWILTYGPIAEGLHVLHRCDNRSCVRPEHLFLGTHAVNMQDMVDKGRAFRKPQSPFERALKK